MPGIQVGKVTPQEARVRTLSVTMIQTYHDPEELPYDTGKRASARIKSKDGQYCFQFQSSRLEYEGSREIVGRMWNGDEKIGLLSAVYIDRTYGNFFERCDQRSSELQEVGTLLCDNAGRIRKVLRQAIGDPQKIQVASQRGFLYIEDVHIKRAHRGRDLSLVFVDALLRTKRFPWTLAATCPLPWDYADQRGCRGREERQQGIDKVCRVFVRLGFRQVRPTSLYFYLTRDMLADQPLSKEEALAVPIVHRAERDEEPQSGPSKELKECITNSLAMPSALIELCSKGANPDAVQALHVAVANKKNALLPTLINQCGAHVNHCDCDGNTALHVAACGFYLDGMSILLRAGANPLHRNLQGKTPRKVAKDAARSLQDFATCFGLPIGNLKSHELHIMKVIEMRARAICNILLASRVLLLSSLECSAFEPLPRENIRQILLFIDDERSLTTEQKQQIFSFASRRDSLGKWGEFVNLVGPILSENIAASVGGSQSFQSKRRKITRT